MRQPLLSQWKLILILQKIELTNRMWKIHWRIRVSISVLPACKAGAPPFQLIPQFRNLCGIRGLHDLFCVSELIVTYLKDVQLSWSHKPGYGRISILQDKKSLETGTSICHIELRARKDLTKSVSFKISTFLVSEIL